LVSEKPDPRSPRPVRPAPAGAALPDRERRAAPQSNAANNHTHPRDRDRPRRFVPSPPRQRDERKERKAGAQGPATAPTLPSRPVVAFRRSVRRVDLKPPPHPTPRLRLLSPLRYCFSLPACLLPFSVAVPRLRRVATRRSLVRSGLPARDRVWEVFARASDRCGAAVSSSSSW
jgi:hypothetical protein